MKYRQLTKEQLESLHKEFAQFLASQEIDVNEWTKIKEENPALVQEELNLFSDMVWEDVLTRVEYIDHFSAQTINLFKCDEDSISRIVITTTKEMDFLSKEGYEWLLQNPNDDSIELFTGKKVYEKERNQEIFSLIEQGGNISKGELFSYFQRLINE